MGPRPDGRPELDTFLAELDEMDDAVLTRLADQVNEPPQWRVVSRSWMKRRASWMHEQVDAPQQMAELETKQLTELGKAKRTSTQKIWLHNRSGLPGRRGLDSKGQSRVSGQSWLVTRWRLSWSTASQGSRSWIDREAAAN